MFHERGSVLVPVLLLSTLLTLGIVLILQNQIIQKKAIGDFKIFLKNRRSFQHDLMKYRSYSIENILKKSNVRLIQKERKNLHCRSFDYHFYFQLNQGFYFYKNTDFKKEIELNDEFLLFHPLEIHYLNTKLKLISVTEGNQYIIYFYDKISDKIVLKKYFIGQPFYQLVGDPINSLYIQDKLYLYKVDFASNEPLEIQTLQPIFSRDKILDLAPVITRDAKGDGRRVTILTSNEPIVYEELSKMEQPFLAEFQHFYFSEGLN